MTPLDLTPYEDPGLYLEMPDGERIVLTHDRIENEIAALLNDTEALPLHIRAAADYQACAVCPERHTAKICHAITTTLPFIDQIDRYMSYDHVVAVYRDTKNNAFTIRETTMQEALQYISILSLVHYCEVGRKYDQYFAGINPLMPTNQIADAVFRNMYLACNGNLSTLTILLETMQKEILETTRCQVKRLRLISQRDAFLNAFVATQSTTEMMLIQLGRKIDEVARSTTSS